ncbi:MAG TPA: APC family permease [Anaerolineae bacterium]|nr:APC family permease [Anaerolineae bacterium]
MFFKSYIPAEERAEANRKLPKLFVEGLLLGGTGLGIFALIFEIAADAFSVAAYQTLLAIHGAAGYHRIAIWAFVVLSILLFFGIVPAYKAGSYLRPNAGGSGPMVEAIGPGWLRWLSWVGTSLFFVDAVLTIIISSISAADVTMLVMPELAPYRILLAEFFAFFIMVVLVLMGPKKAVPLFLIGGGAFTLFTLAALSLVAVEAAIHPEWAFLTDGIVRRLEATRVVEHVVRVQQDMATLGTVVIMQLFFRSMSSAMLGFSGYEVIPASGKHAARPKWKVISVALTLAAVFLIGTGMAQLYASKVWEIPATEGYSTLLIEYEIVAIQAMSPGVQPEAIVVTPADRLAAEQVYAEEALANPFEGILGGKIRPPKPPPPDHEQFIEDVSYDIAVSRAITETLAGSPGATFLFIAGTLMAIILLLAQGGGYVGGAAVAANAARLGRLPGFLLDDRIGIAIIWGVSAVLIPIIRQVVVVESYYAFGFVSAFIITSTAVFFVRNDVLEKKGIKPGSPEAKSLRFAGARGMFASYLMGAVLVAEKTHALYAVAVAGIILTAIQLLVANGGVKKQDVRRLMDAIVASKEKIKPRSGIERAIEQARQRGIADALVDLQREGRLVKFNVDFWRIQQLIAYLYNLDPAIFNKKAEEHEDERIEEPNLILAEAYERAYAQKETLLQRIEKYSHFGIFMFIHNYHVNWISPETGRGPEVVQQAMVDILFPLTPHEEIWAEYKAFKPIRQPEPIWQFSRQRYLWAKDQWPNLSDRITTIWTLQDFGLLPKDIEFDMVVTVANGKEFRRIHVHATMPEDEDYTAVKEDIATPLLEPEEVVSMEETDLAEPAATKEEVPTEEEGDER